MSWERDTLEENQRANCSDDWDAVCDLLGRAPAGPFVVVVRRPDGTPVVIENAPLLDDGRPMPTRYWLVDPAVRDAVSRLEADGGVRRAQTAVPADAVSDAHARHAAERDQALPPGHRGPIPSGGVGGTRRGVKCLHAHLAWYLAGGDDPVGRWASEQLGVRPEQFVASSATRDAPPNAVAAVDCGSNSTRLLVVSSGGEVLQREMRITRLGEGVDATGVLSRAAMDRTLAVLRAYRRSIEAHAVRRVRLVATSAVRGAANAREFMAAAAEIGGVEPEILSGEEEGRLSFVGATAHLPRDLDGGGDVLVVDIGGGSTELIVGRPSAGAGPAQAKTVTSLDIGCVRVTERFLAGDPPTSEDMARARRAVTEQVQDARAHLRALAPGSLLVGLAGTVSTITCLDRGIATHDRARIHHAQLTHEAVEAWLRVLSGEPIRRRLERPGMVEGREDVIVGGVLVLAVVMEAFGFERCLVSEDDILDGIAAALQASC
jgi:exopolyphosphatase/guanosine-5'-triphosphate,3'-diphosphate pyrophosphatase